MIRIVIHNEWPILQNIHIKLKKLLNDWSLVTQQNNKNGSSVLLARAQTTQLQLDIAQCLVEQAWSSEV